MRECWINVYPDLRDPDTGEGHYLANPAPSRFDANRNACGRALVTPRELRRAGVGYRLRVRLKPEAAR